jgi:hypothetical protein
MMAVHHGDEPSFPEHRSAAGIATDADSLVRRNLQDRSPGIAGRERVIVPGS